VRGRATEPVVAIRNARGADGAQSRATTGARHGTRLDRIARMRLVALVGVVAACARAGGSGVDGGGPPDADRGPLAHCAPAAPLPDWAAATATASLRAACGAIELDLDALAGGMTRVRYAIAGAPAPRSWAVVDEPGAATDVAVAGTIDGAVELCTPELAVRVDAACRIRAALPGGAIIAEDAGGFAAIDATLEAETVPAVELDRVAQADRVYGLGERTGTSLDRRGRRLVFWNTDAYDPVHGGWAPGADPLYQGIPFAIHARGGTAWGVFTDEPHRMELDLGAADPARDHLIAFGGPGAPRGAGAPAGLTQYLIPGPRMADVVLRYTALTGRAARPPRWALGYHQSRWGYPDRATVEAIVDRFAAEDLPVSAIWLDIQHLDGFRTFTWDAARFGDRAAFTAALAARGIRTVAIADPGIKIDPGWPVYDGGVAGDHFLRDGAGVIYSGVVWAGASAFPDFTRAATRAWWGDHVGALAAGGISAIWLDVNEPTTFPESGGSTVPVALAVDGDGAPTTMAEAHQVYALLEAGATADALAATGARPFVLSRAGYAGIQRHAAVWTGDVPSTWGGLADTLPMLLGLGMSGVPFVGSDIGGYSGHASSELYARWLALGAVSPFCRGHVTNGVPGQEPWQFGAAVTAIARTRLAERMTWMPYLEAVFAEAAATGAPVLRPLVWEFPEDARLADLGDQAMLGPFVMVAPVVAAGATTRRVVFPAGRWVELPSGVVVEGPTELDVDAPLAALPMWAREGAILPRRGDGAGVLEIDAFPGPAPTTLAVIEDDGEAIAGAATTTVLTLASADDGATLSWTRTGSYAGAAQTFRIRVRPVDGAVAGVELDGAAVAFTADPGDRAIVVDVPAAATGALYLRYDAALADPAPAVALRFEVEVPAGTPESAPVHVAVSTSGWTHEPLAWVAPGVAAGTISVPRGAWVDYKYSRGDWLTVEKGASCDELDNRVRVSAAAPVARDRVAQWRDVCGN
jgi:alpha-glucosidase